MRAPADFIVTRHLLTHPDDSPADLAKHALLEPTGPRLRLASVARAMHRIERETERRDPLLFRRLVRHPERPRHRSVQLRVADAIQVWSAWHERAPFPHWLSGEFAAAAIDRRPLVPSRCLVYVRLKDMTEAVRSVMRPFTGLLAPPERANFTIRAADPWLHTMTGDDGVAYVESGQRRLDYWESRHIQLTEVYDDRTLHD